ncbi:unnamed protein product [Colias eurytheme]|nr:unnamed protein product [Colias eurytheme]
MQALHRENELAWLLGDSGYPQWPWIMTPYTDASPGSVQELYNKKHSKARVVIENTFGRLKNRWRCCIKYRPPHYKLDKCAQLITACCVLHNFALHHNVPDPDDDLGSDDDDDTFVRHDAVVGGDLIIGRAMRDQLARRLVERS